MHVTRTNLIVASLILAFSGLVIYGALYFGALLRERNALPSDVERTLGTVPLTLEDGNSLSIDVLKGKVVVVASWATWCPSCDQMLVDLARAKERFGSDVEIIAVNRAEEPRIVEDYRAINTLPSGITYVTDPNDAYFDVVNGRSMPEMIIYDQNGTVIEHRLDAPPFQALMTTLESLTKK